ncbi:MAG: polyprenyl synthetase family protein [Elusimicrobia bacterium]|nr:polyprenyl synthetase family protein [Elusimicrobiota bacterium]
MNPVLENYLKDKGALVDKELKRLIAADARAAIPFLGPQPETLRKAMTYSLMAGGKRLRPILVLAAAECCGKQGTRALKTACALEMIHTYSLIHDDLPAMDDDDLRRGKPTNHKVFGEAIAILAGDGLLTYAFELAAANAQEAKLDASDGYELVRVIASGAGARGMVGGQVADLEAEGWKGLRNGKAAAAKKLLEYIHIHKTAALITASVEAGAILGGATAAQRAALREYGRAIGLAFQIADDVLDVVGEKKLLGKSGSDAANEKLTYARLYGIDASRGMARELIERAHRSLSIFGKRARVLDALADYIVEREK